MKKIFVLSIVLLFNCVARSQSTREEHSATIISQTMQDSLNLNNELKNSIYLATLQINLQKTQIRLQYQPSDTLGIFLNLAEIRRDSLYQTILPNSTYLMYLQKKIKLMSSN